MKVKSEICMGCGITFQCERKRKYCTMSCQKTAGQLKRGKSHDKTCDRNEWFVKYKEMIQPYHKRNLDDVVNKILKRADTLKNSLASRSKKHNVDCNITLEELRNLIYNSYGTKCKYCEKILTIKNFVVDHILPVSKGGHSNLDNLQLICKTSNSMKGSLTEDDFFILLDWLQTVSEELRKDISIRLARGIH